MKQNVCYRDVTWLNGDRLVLAAHEGIVVLISPSDVLQEWDVYAGGKLDGPTSFRSRDPNPGQENSTFLETDGNFYSGDSSSSSSGLAGRPQGDNMSVSESFCCFRQGGFSARTHQGTSYTSPHECVIACAFSVFKHPFLNLSGACGSLLASYQFVSRFFRGTMYRRTVYHSCVYHHPAPASSGDKKQV